MPRKVISSENSANDSNIEPLEPGQYNDCVLERVYGFRQRVKGDDGSEFIRNKLSLYWDSGETLPDSDDPFYINQGFITFSFNERANFSKILTAFGLYKEGGNYDVEYEFGGDYAGQDFDALPIYAGSGPRKDIEVPLTTLKVDGTELIGAKATLVVNIRKGWNNVEAVLPSSNRKRKAKQGKLDDGAKQRKAREWARDLTNPDGEPLYRNTTEVATTMRALFEQYVANLPRGEEPREDEFLRRWKDANTAWSEGREYNMDEFPPDLPFDL